MNDAATVNEINDRIAQKRKSYLDRYAAGVIDVWDRSAKVVVYDVGGPLVYHGYDAVEQTTNEFVDECSGPIDCDFGDVTVQASGDLAISWSIVHIRVELKSGQRIDLRMRQTDVWNRIDGQWYVVHEHNSEPLNPETLQSRYGLTPETVATLS